MYDGRHMLVTDIARDGMLSGPNFDLIRQCARTLPGWQIQASGGVASADQLRELAQARAAGAVVGKALWEGRFTLAAALAHARP
jgi:phosphoribosylformimino-5-aminoimidazole carboxamide ribotide isomerase